MNQRKKQNSPRDMRESHETWHLNVHFAPLL